MSSGFDINPNAARLVHGLNSPSFSGAARKAGTIPVGEVLFAGKSDKKDSKRSPRASLNRKIAEIWVQWPKLVLKLQKFLAKFGFFKGKTTPADKGIEDILKAARPDKINAAEFDRPSTGVSKASRTFTQNDPLVKMYGKGQYMHILDTSGINWDEAKIARDAIQNFYDGQGQTLDDTTISVAPNGDKRRIKLSASATYDPDKLLGVGSTGKGGENRDINTGGFGAGAKDVALCLLRDHGVDKVTYRSGEWQIDYYLADPGEEHTLDRNAQGLHAKLTILDKPIKGNELEFSTTNNKLAKMFETGKDLYYHSGNPDFKNPTYENAIGGFKLVGDDEEGHFYHAGQRREVGYHEGWKALDGLQVWTNKKLLPEESRDRLSYSEYQVKDCLQRIIGAMSAEECGQAIQMMTSDWFVDDAPTGPIGMLGSLAKSQDKVGQNKTMILGLILRQLGELTDKGKKDMPFELPKGLFAVTSGNPEAIGELKDRGYIPVVEGFRELGVVTEDKLIQQLNINNKAIQSRIATPKDKARITVMKDVLTTLRGQMDEMTFFRETDFAKAARNDWVVTEGSKDKLHDSVMTEDTVAKTMNVQADWLRGDDFTHALTDLLFNSSLFQYYDEERQQLVDWLLNNREQVEGWRKRWDEAAAKTTITA